MEINMNETYTMNTKSESDNHEHSHELMDSGEVNRRTFLKLTGFTFAGAMLAGCERPPEKTAVPYPEQPPEITPGVAAWYASTCAGCSAGCGILVKNRDGRPIKVEGNPDHPVSKGGLCMVGHAMLLGLYDSKRLANPVLRGSESTWEKIDGEILKSLAGIRSSGGAVRVLTGTNNGPTYRNLIATFLGQFGDAKHVAYDPLSTSAILDAHQSTHGARVLPRYRFGNAEVIASFDADFLGTWISPVEFTHGYRSGRVLEGKPMKMSHHIQFESRLSLTGSNADKRVSVAPQEIPLLVARLASLTANEAGRSFPQGSNEPSAYDDHLKKLAKRLWNSRGKSLVVCGMNDVAVQRVVNFINETLGNYGTTIDLAQPSKQKQGSDGALKELIEEMKAGKVAALFVHGVNPVYDLPQAEEFIGAIERIPLVVSIAERVNETAEHATCVCPDHHFLESWNDGEPATGVFTMSQPTIQPLTASRSSLESFARWSGMSATALELVQQTWRTNIFPKSGKLDFQTFWDQSVHDGFNTVDIRQTAGAFNAASITPILPEQSDAPFTALLYAKLGTLDGSHAHNPWLLEVPDPITKVSWDNYAALSMNDAKNLGVAQGDIVRVESVDGKAKALELPVYVQEGQHDGVVAIALGWGRKGTDRFASVGPEWIQKQPTTVAGSLVGKNAAPLLRFTDSGIAYSNGVKLTATGKKSLFACTQDHNVVDNPIGHAEPRPLIQETTFAAFAKDPSSGSFHKHEINSLWGDIHKYPDHHWGMAIDLTACTGCSACVVSCQVENNIPVVGKDEVSRTRELHWMRIDRYYSENEDGLRASYLPMMCQQCDNAPCETVCPVLATVHSSEGLNQQVYNRCVGTRYCSNNCPYKMRRFNWFNYAHDDVRENLVLNPDVTVRMRGVMEKCTFCVQRIQEAKIAAKREGRTVADGEIKTACEQSCPAQAIVFGDMNDRDSRLVKRMQLQRSYKVIEEVNTQPSVTYQTLVRNGDAAIGGGHHG